MAAPSVSFLWVLRGLIQQLLFLLLLPFLIMGLPGLQGPLPLISYLQFCLTSRKTACLLEKAGLQILPPPIRATWPSFHLWNQLSKIQNNGRPRKASSIHAHTDWRSPLVYTHGFWEQGKNEREKSDNPKKPHVGRTEESRLEVAAHTETRTVEAAEDGAQVQARPGLHSETSCQRN